jgi:hypothetical protein
MGRMAKMDRKAGMPAGRMAAPMRSEGVSDQELALLRRRQPTAIVSQQVTVEGDRFVCVDLPGRQLSCHITALDGCFVVFSETGQVLAQGVRFSTVLERAGL